MKMDSDLKRFYFVGLRPVRFVPTRDGGLLVLKMNWETGVFEYGMEYLDRAMFGHHDVSLVSEDEFIQKVEAWRARNLTVEGPMSALYSVINAMEDQAKEQNRELTEEERALTAELRRQTYKRFEQEHPLKPPSG